jgi:DNA-binding transcriptional LysR family regulator
MPDLDLDLLRAFIAVAETGGFTAATSVINRSQSAVSQKIFRLEETLQFRVFDRTSRSLNLTRDGMRLLASGRRMLEHYDAFMREMRDPPAVSTLRLGVSENLVHTQLPRLLSRFSHMHPDLRLELTTGSSANLLADHEAGHLDVVISKRKKERTSNRGRVIWREPLVWIAASDYQADALGPARLVMMRPPCAYSDVMIEALSASKREWIGTCITSSLVGTQAAVIGGLGVTVLGQSFVQLGMRILPVSKLWPALPMTEVAVTGDKADTQHLVEPLISLLTEELTKVRSLALEV